MTPGRNLCVSIGQLLLFLAFFAVVQEVAAKSTETVMSTWQLGAPDAFGILPILVGLLMAAILCNGPVGRAKLVLAAVVAVGLGALTWSLGAAANIYLVLSLVWVLVQGRMAFAWVRREQREQQEDDTDLSVRGVVTLREAARSAGAGNKAIRLGRMKAAGLPVPDGLAITDHALERARQNGKLMDADRQKIQKLHRRLRADRVAVRSSGLKEDGGDKSYAGVYESVLDASCLQQLS